MSLQAIYDGARFSEKGFNKIGRAHMKWRVLGPSEGRSECDVCRQARTDLAHLENVKTGNIFCKRCYVKHFEFK